MNLIDAEAWYAATMESTGHSRRLRERLRERRRAKEWTQDQLAEAITEELGRERTYTKAAISMWENFARHPPIDAFAAWARVLDMRLVVDLDDDGTARVALLVLPDTREVVAAFESATPEEKALVHRLLTLFPDLDDRDRRILSNDLDLLEGEVAIRRRKSAP